MTKRRMTTQRRPSWVGARASCIVGYSEVESWSLRNRIERLYREIVELKP